MRHVAERSGVVIREVTARREGPDPRDALWEVNAAAEDWLRRTLREVTRGQTRRASTCAQREVGLDVADRFGLGFSPRDDSLRAHLATLGFDDARQLEAGLLVKREDSARIVPRFRGRLMFTIYDTSARVAGFGGRVIGAGEPKYLNSPETIAFTKGRMLYGLNWARNAIRKADRVLLVEGYFDLVRLVVAGVEEVIAPLGTALTPDQAALIARHSKNAFLVYDSDKAGLKATFRAADELLRHGVSVRVVTLPPGEDPDTFARESRPRRSGEAPRVGGRRHRTENPASRAGRLVRRPAQASPGNRPPAPDDPGHGRRGHPRHVPGPSERGDRRRPARTDCRGGGTGGW